MKKAFLTVMIAMLGGLVMAQQRDTVPMPKVNADSVLKHVVEITSDDYMGRLAGTKGYDMAAQYVVRTLSHYGLKPQGDSWYQKFEVESNEVENAKFEVYLPGSKEKHVYTLGKDFACAGMTGRGYVDAQMVFCGYGIDIAGVNEYKNVDVKGKIAVVLAGAPSEGWLPAAAMQRSTSLRDKARAAERHGAIGMLAINISRSCASDIPQARVYCGSLPHLATFPILQLTLDCGRELLRGEQMALDTAIYRLQAEHQISSFPLRKKGEIDINARYTPRAITSNVVAVLEGSDYKLKKEYIVIGASMDAGGMQGETCIFPGADINAAGVGALLETARVLSDPKYRPKRSIVFVFFGASEHQYLGSRIFASNFSKLSKIDAFINVQNIGSGDSLIVQGDNRYPELWSIAARRDSLCSYPLLCHTAEKSNPHGDAAVFDTIGIPSLVITTHNGMLNNHTPADIWENIDMRIATHCAKILAETAAQLGEGLYQGRSPRSRMYRF